MACRNIQKSQTEKENNNRKMNVKSIRLSNRADSKQEERKKNNKRNKEKATKKEM